MCQDKQLDYLREELVEQAVVRGDMGRELQEVVDKEQHHQEQTVKALKDIQTSSLAMEHSHRKVEAAYNRDRWGRRCKRCRRLRRWWLVRDDIEGVVKRNVVRKHIKLIILQRYRMQERCISKDGDAGG